MYSYSIFAVSDDLGVSDAEEIRSFTRGHLTAYKVPRVIDEVDALPRSLVGKVIRRQVREEVLERPLEAGALPAQESSP